MSIPLEFQSNTSNRYQQSGNCNDKEISSDDLVILDVYTSEGYFFNVELADPFDKYELPRVISDTIVNSWKSDPLKFYQNQLNFVTWCSTTGCGVRYEHLTHSNPTISILFFNFASINKLDGC